MDGSAKTVAVNLPVRGLELHEHRDVVDRLVTAGLRDVWVDEFNGVDGVAALAALSAWGPQLSITTAITNVFTRSPALLAMAAATVAQLAPGRATFGVGASSRVIVEQWNGVPYDQPYTRVAETLDFLRDVLRDGQSTRRFATLRTEGFRLAAVPASPPRLAVGALGLRMQRLAAAKADVLVTGMLAPGDVGRVRELAADVRREAPGRLEIHAGVFVLPPDDPDSLDVAARRHLTAYLPVPAYAAFQRWLGRGAALAEMGERWARGDRRGAVAAIPADVVEQLVVFGSLEDCVAGVRRYLAAGVDGVNILIPATTAAEPAAVVDFQCRLVAALEAARDR